MGQLLTEQQVRAIERREERLHEREFKLEFPDCPDQGSTSEEIMIYLKWVAENRARIDKFNRKFDRRHNY